MANFDKYFPLLLSYEGGYVDNPLDHGGATKYGVTLAEWIRNGYDKTGDGHIDKEDIKVLSVEDTKRIAKLLYWDVIKGDFIDSQSIAELLCDWAYMSGPVNPVKKLQRILNLESDGKIGPKTIAKLNLSKPRGVFELLKTSRENYFRAIVRNNPSQSIFLKGWLSRNNKFIFHDT